MDLEALRDEFTKKVDIFKHLEEEALFIIKTSLTERGIKIHDISSRIKEFESFIQKAERKQLENPFEEIKDIVGIRIVCLFLSDIPLIADAIRQSFKVLSEDNKIEDCEVSSFGYLSFHFIVSLKEECSGPRYDQVKGVPVEIQVRTIAMHAWATISHYLDYKTDVDVPKDLRRDFFALSGLFFVADKHFEMFFRSAKESRDKMSATPKKVLIQSNHEINLDSLSAYLAAKFPDRERADPLRISGLISELRKKGFRTISEVDKFIEEKMKEALSLEKSMSEENLIRDSDNEGRPTDRYMDIGIVRVMLYPQRYYKILPRKK